MSSVTFNRHANGVTRIQRLGYNGGWRELSKSVQTRDGYKCRECGELPLQRRSRGGKLETHHIRPKARGGTDTMSNLISLCDKCHAKKHKR